MELNWEAIGAIGEVLGSIAVVTTLAYLAVQVRQNTKGLRNAAYQHVQSDLNTARAAVAENQTLARSLRLGMFETGELNADEAMQFHFWMLQAMWAFHSCHRQYQEGLIGEGEMNARNREIAAFKGSPAFAAWWVSASQFFDRSFREFVDKVEVGDPVTFNEGTRKWGRASSVDQT